MALLTMALLTMALLTTAMLTMAGKTLLPEPRFVVKNFHDVDRSTSAAPITPLKRQPLRLRRAGNGERVPLSPLLSPGGEPRDLAPAAARRNSARSESNTLPMLCAPSHPAVLHPIPALHPLTRVDHFFRPAPHTLTTRHFYQVRLPPRFQVRPPPPAASARVERGRK